MFLMAIKRNQTWFAASNSICIVQVALSKWKINLFNNWFTRNISGFEDNFNAFRDFVTNMFCVLFSCQVFVDVNT